MIGGSASKADDLYLLTREKDVLKRDLKREQEKTEKLQS